MTQPDFMTRNNPPISHRERKVSRMVLWFENMIKVPLFGCQRCGECILSSTGYICSQQCPKQLRNGPCGGTSSDGSCEVDPEQPCVWYQIYHRSKKLNRLSLLYRFKKIHNWNLQGTSAWLNVFKKRAEPPVMRVKNDGQKIKELTSNDTPR